MRELAASIWLELARVSAIIILLNETEAILNYYFYGRVGSLNLARTCARHRYNHTFK